MKLLERKLLNLQCKLNEGGSLKIAIIGLGSVGNYLLNYLLSYYDNIEIFVIGRSTSKMESDINIAKVAAGIRNNIYLKVVPCEIDLGNIDQLTNLLSSIQPDFIVNSSRAYSHIKYGSISWKNVRAYGIWSPLSVKLIKNIMESVQISGTSPIVINTSYSDATNAWLKTGGYCYPDFGSGNLNHLIPRIKLAVASLIRIDDPNNIDVIISTSHFHDVLISKEGITQGIDPLLNIAYHGTNIEVDLEKVFSLCNISMPTDEKRNMMNASSNFEIIFRITECIRKRSNAIIHSPGFCGFIGGYPVEVDFTGNSNTSPVKIHEKYFSFEEMNKTNQRSIYQDGIEAVTNGNLVYTDELIEKTYKAFKFILPKVVNIKDSDMIANDIINNIIEKYK